MNSQGHNNTISNKLKLLTEQNEDSQLILIRPKKCKIMVSEIAEQPPMDQFKMQNLHESESLPQTFRKLPRSYIQMRYVTTFINNLRTGYRNYKQLTKYHFNLIGDNSFHYHRRKSTQAFQTFHIDWTFFQKIKQYYRHKLSALEKFCLTIPLIYPESKFKLFWDALATLARLYFLYLIPIDLAWADIQFIFGFYLNSTLVMLGIIVMDMLLGLNTAHYESGQVVITRSKILQRHLTKSYGLEWISTILLVVYWVLATQYDIIVDVKVNPFYLSLLIFLVHHKTISNNFTYYEEGLNLSKKISSILELGKLLILLFYMLHIFSCLWAWAGLYSYENDDPSWVHKSNVIDQLWNVQYLNAFYYSSVTMFTVGYGDITPQNNMEKLIAICFIMVSSFQLPYSVNTIGKIIEQISLEAEEKKSRLRLINSFMQNKKVSHNLQFQIREYLTYYWLQQKNQEAEQQQQIIDILSQKLRDQLMSEVNQVLLNSCPLFQNRFSQELKKELVKNIKSLLLSPECFVQLDLSDPFLCFIQEGSIQIIIDSGGNRKISELHSGMTLGMMGFVTDTLAPEKYKSVGFSKLMILKKSEFMRVIKEFPQDLEVFQQLKDIMLFNPDKYVFISKCFSCNSIQHKLINCPLLHYVPDREALIKEHQYSQQQSRKHYQRRKRKRRLGHFIGTDEDIEKAAFITQQENQQLVNMYKLSLMENAQDNESARACRQPQRKTLISNVNRKSDVQLIQIQDNSAKQLLKFQKIVRKIVSLNKVYPQFLINAFTTFNATTDIWMNTEYQLSVLKQRLFQFAHAPKGLDNCVQQVQQMILKLNPKKYIDDECFENQRNYKHYYTKFNAQEIRKQSTYRRHSKLISRYLPYLMYPMYIIQKYHISDSDYKVVIGPG